MVFFHHGYFQWKKPASWKTNFPSKNPSDRHFVTEPNVNTYHFTAHIGPFKDMDTVDYSAYSILSNRLEKQRLKHVHYSAC